MSISSRLEKRDEYYLLSFKYSVRQKSRMEAEPLETLNIENIPL